MRGDRLSDKDEDLLEGLVVAARGKFARASTLSQLPVEVFAAVFVERLAASLVLNLALPLEKVLDGIRSEHTRLRGEESSDD